MGQVHTLDSEALGESRTLNIYLPPSYAADTVDSYPVIYLLDGSAHEDYPHVAGLMQFLQLYRLIPESILVGIANVDRYRDFSYPSSDPEDDKYVPTNGGAAAFTQFVAEELQPYVEQNLKGTGPKTIIGQSMGGLYASAVLMKQPELFDDYIIVSPSLWWDKQSMVNTAEAYFRTNKALSKRIYVTMGKEHPVMHQVANKLVDAMQVAENPNLQVWFEPILDEDHASILHMAIYKALRTLHTPQH